MALQGSEQQSVPCITNTNGAVIRSYNQQFSGTFLSCGEAADCPRAMAFKDLLLLVVLKNNPPFHKSNLPKTFKNSELKLLWTLPLLPTYSPNARQLHPCCSWPLLPDLVRQMHRKPFAAFDLNCTAPTTIWLQCSLPDFGLFHCYFSFLKQGLAMQPSWALNYVASPDYS